MGCTGIDACTEYEFVKSMDDRQSGQCRGSLAVLAFNPDRLDLLIESLCSTRAVEVLWDGATMSYSDRVTFTLCVAHWMDLSFLAGLRAHQFGRDDWFGEANDLLKDLCATQGWDIKELSNMVRWRKVQFT